MVGLRRICFCCWFVFVWICLLRVSVLSGGSFDFIMLVADVVLG